MTMARKGVRGQRHTPKYKYVMLKYCSIKLIDVPLCVVLGIETSRIEVFAPKGTGQLMCIYGSHVGECCIGT